MSALPINSTVPPVDFKGQLQTIIMRTFSNKIDIQYERGQSDSLDIYHSTLVLSHISDSTVYHRFQTIDSSDYSLSDLRGKKLRKACEQKAAEIAITKLNDITFANPSPTDIRRKKSYHVSEKNHTNLARITPESSSEINVENCWERDSLNQRNESSEIRTIKENLNGIYRNDLSSTISRSESRQIKIKGKNDIQ